MKQVFSTHQGIEIAEVPYPCVKKGHVLVEVEYSFISSGTEINTLSEVEFKPKKSISDGVTKIRKALSTLLNKGLSETIHKIHQFINHQKELGEQIHDRYVPLGYSVSGRVLELGEGVTDLSIGERVACAGSKLATHSELVLVPRNLIAKIPKKCTQKNASSVALGSIAMHAVRRSQVSLGDNVLLIGLGLVGQLIAQMLQISGARVIGFDLIKKRSEECEKIGVGPCFSDYTSLQEFIQKEMNGLGVDSCIMAASSESENLLNQCLSFVRKKGRIVVVGAIPIHLEYKLFRDKEIDIIASNSYGPGRYEESYEIHGQDYPFHHVRWTENRNMVEYLRLLESDKIKLNLPEFEFKNAEHAYAELKTNAKRPLGIFLNYGSCADKNKHASQILLSKPSQSSKAVKLAVIGVGKYTTQTIMPILDQLQDKAQVFALCSRSSTPMYSMAKKYNISNITNRYEDVLENPEIDSVVISTRHNSHASLVLQALEARKHVFVEKPLALSEEELIKIESYFREKSNNSQVLQVGFNRRFSPLFKQINSLIRNRVHPLMVNYQVNAGYMKPEHWFKGEEGGGRNLGEACHMYDLFNFLVGSPRKKLTVSSLGRGHHEHAMNENFATTLSYEDGSLCHLTYTSLGSKSFPKEILTIYVDGQVCVIQDFSQIQIVGHRPLNSTSKQIQKGHKEEFEAFLNACDGGEWPISWNDQIEATRIALEVENNILVQTNSESIRVTQ